MKTETRQKQAKPSATKLTRWFALYLCGPELAGFQQPPVSFLNSACEWFLQNTDQLRNAGSKAPIIVEQVTICWPTSPDKWGDTLLKKALSKKSLGPLYFVDRDGIRRCEPYTRAHVKERRQQNFIILGEVCSLDAKLIDRDGNSRSLADMVGFRDPTQSGLSPNNVRVFGKLKRTRD